MQKTKHLLATILLVSFLGIITGEGSAVEVGKVNIHGYIAQGYLHTSDFDLYVDGTEKGTFEFNELAINFSSYLTKRLFLNTQFMSMDFGDISNDEVIIDLASADYHWKDYAGIRVGIIKIPHGLYNETRDTDMLRVGIFLPNSVYTETFRDAFTRMVGGGIYGTVPGGFSYQVLYGLSNMQDDSPLVAAFAQRAGGQARGVDNGFMYVANVQWERFSGLRLGASYLGLDAAFSLDRPLIIPTGVTIPGFIPGTYTIPVDINAEEMYAMVGSIEYTWDRLILCAEYAYYSLKFLTDYDLSQMPLSMAFIINASGLLPDSIRYIPEGWYVSAAYAFTDWFTLGLYYTDFIRDKLENRTIDEGHREWVITSRFDINKNWILKLEYHLMRGLYFNADGATSATHGDDYWHLFGVKTSFNF